MRMGLLSYINSLPVTYGLESGAVPFSGDFVKGEPTTLNGMALRGELDVTPISSVHYLLCAEHYRVVPGIALCSAGPVRSVKLFSRVPIDKLSGRWVAITKASATSRILLQLLVPGVLCEDLQHDHDGPIELTNDRPAVLLIGDQALLQPPLCEFQLDLGQAWYEQTGMPMVWALWIARHDAEMENVVAHLESSRRWGEHHMDLVIQEALRRTELSRPQLDAYFQGLRYQFDDFELEGLRQFYLRASRLELVSSQLLSRVRLPHFSSL